MLGENLEDLRHNEGGRQLGEADLARLIAAAAEPLPALEDTEAFGARFDRFGAARVVLLGEATHGTGEFYCARAAVTSAVDGRPSSGPGASLHQRLCRAVGRLRCRVDHARPCPRAVGAAHRQRHSWTTRVRLFATGRQAARSNPTPSVSAAS